MIYIFANASKSILLILEKFNFLCVCCGKTQTRAMQNKKIFCNFIKFSLEM